ncbi:hypothetical protein Tco_1404308 [Tanacetum coccineum]
MLSLSLQPIMTILSWLHLENDLSLSRQQLWVSPNTLRTLSNMSVKCSYQPWKSHLVSFIASNMTLLIGLEQSYVQSITNLPPPFLMKEVSSYCFMCKEEDRSSAYPKCQIHKTNQPSPDGREIFGMSIPDALLIYEIKGAPYYNDYQEHVAKYQQILDAERGKVEEGGATESSKATKVTKPKAAKWEQNAQAKSPLRLIDEPSDEGVPVEEPAHDDEEADLQRALELKVQGNKKRKRKSLKKEQRRTPMPTEPSRQADSPSLDAELPLTDSETESDEEVHVINVVDQDEGQARPNPGEQDEGRAGPNPGEQDDGHAGSNPGDAAVSQPQPSHVVHAGPNLEHMDLETTDASTQQKLEQIDEEFTTTAYPNVQENLKLLNEDQFFVEKTQAEKLGKTNVEAEVQSIVSVPIHQDTSSVPPMTTLVIDLTKLYKLENLNIPHQVSKAVDEIVTDAVDWVMQAPLRARFRDLPTVDMKEIIQQLMFEDNTYKTHEVHNDLYEALQKSECELDISTNQRLAEYGGASAKKKRKKRAAPRTPSGSPPSPPPHPPPPAGAYGALADIPGALGWLSPTDCLMQDDSIPEEHERPATPEPAWTIPSSNKSYVVNNWASTLATTYEPPAENSLLVKIGDYEEYLRYGSKGSNPALSISKMKAASYPDFGLEMLVPGQIWIDDVSTSINVKIVQFNKIYKFSNRTLTRILEALDYRVKELKVKRLNPGMNTQFRTEKDVTRNKEFIAAIKRRLKTRRIYQNLECFVGGRVCDIDYRLLQRTE